MVKETPCVFVYHCLPCEQGVSEGVKNIVMGITPVWVKLAFFAVVGGVTSALALFVSKHVSVNFSMSFH